ncbi:PREDICTED: meiosis expressed gene 1 protein homolog isoform X1 [Ficedula albicollis]|nr:PREDICTED: meiosis expressed gene 1 protein homolog isoform X1 [Ficedula albicollis]
MVTHKVPDLPTCLEENHSLGESSTSCKEVLNTNDTKMSEVSKVMTKADIKPKSMHRAKIWSDDVENLYRFQQAGYRDEVEYKQVKQVDKDRIINLVVGGLTTLLLVVTLISAFVFPQLPPKPVNVFFAFCISLCCISAGILIYWYRQGDLEPKFRNLIYYILFSIVMLCICANLYFHEVGK